MPRKSEKSQPSGRAATSTKPIGAGPLARWLTICFVKMRNQTYIRRVWKRPPGLLTVFGRCIKVYPFENLAEAHAMQFVAQHTSIPVPKVHCAFVQNGKTYIVMDRIEGQMVGRGWQSRSDESKKRILDQLRGMVNELRSIRRVPESTVVSGVDGGPFCDPRLPSTLFWGPFATVRDFHQALVNNIDFQVVSSESMGPEYSDLNDLFAFYRQSPETLVFTHGDLSWRNILVNGDDVVGIIDWETSGWLPPYWEYICAKMVIYNAFSDEEIDMYVDPMPYEFEMDNIRQKYFQF
ncbi:hypothetical protein PLIIFM63780_003595 [Purpureocillium lilacinum]|nr:hypothetical protein PLIIFM63780_003595 [Purpureocillium lilacinum]